MRSDQVFDPGSDEDSECYRLSGTLTEFENTWHLANSYSSCLASPVPPPNTPSDGAAAIASVPESPAAGVVAAAPHRFA